MTHLFLYQFIEFIDISKPDASRSRLIIAQMLASAARHHKKKDLS